MFRLDRLATQALDDLVDSPVVE